MIQCPNCKHNIMSRSEFCPLCAANFSQLGVSELDINKTQRHFAKRSKLSFLSYSLFDTIYLSILFCVSIPAILTEGFLMNWDIRYSLIPISILVYLYILLRLTINSSKFFPQRVLIQAISLSVIGYFIMNAAREKEIFFAYISPTIFLISLITVAVYVFINFKLPKKHAASLLLMALASMSPHVLTIIWGIEKRIYAIAVAGIAAAFIIITIATFAKRLWHELKALFNV